MKTTFLTVLVFFDVKTRPCHSEFRKRTLAQLYCIAVMHSVPKYVSLPKGFSLLIHPGLTCYVVGHFGYFVLGWSGGVKNEKGCIFFRNFAVYRSLRLDAQE